MRYLLVDDELLALRNLERILRRIAPGAEILTAEDYRKALAHVGEAFTAVFLDIEMPGMSGLELARCLREKNRRLNIIFVTAYSEYARETYQIHASGYITKPYDEEDIRRELQDLRYPVSEEPESAAAPIRGNEAAAVQNTAKTDSRLQIRCFGYFEAFKNGEPIHFTRKSSKEVLAYLVHLRGASASRLEICSALWEDSVAIDRRKGYFRALITALRNTLQEYGAEDVLICQRDSYAVNMSRLDCDFYRWLADDPDPRVRFRGEYMAQYSWAEEAIGQIFKDTRS